ncbi:MAG TPA: hypothetical protein DDW50_20265 [Firmicutes bacterium]|jgi:hypothetical protein|nr:hypothetical protein [Bacillota bacterium]
MTVEEIALSIGYCGLVCKMCGLCAGCKSENNCCEKQRSPEGCYHYHCCIQKGLNGCWECGEFPCDQDMFSVDKDIRLKAFVRCAREDGVGMLAEYLKRNAGNGMEYHIGNGLRGDYDGLTSEAEVLRLLRTGKK